MRGWLALLLLFSASACTATERTVVTAAQVVDGIALRGDKIDAIAVSSCHAAELKAADLPDLNQAAESVESIRVACDAAFEAVDKLEASIEAVDAVFSAVERKEADVKKLVSAAIAARQAFGEAKEENDRLRSILKEW